MRITKEIRDVLADAVKGFKSGLKPVFNEWGDGLETACLLTAAFHITKSNKCNVYQDRYSYLQLGWDDAYGEWDNPIYQAGNRLGTAMSKQFK